MKECNMLNENLEKSALLAICKSLPKIANVLRDINEHLCHQNAILYQIAENLDDGEDAVATIHCVTTSGIERIISMPVYELVEDWRGECKLCPENDAIVMSAVVFDEELIGDKLPVNSDFGALMDFFVKEAEDEDEEDED